MSVYKDEKTGTWFCMFRYKDFTGKNIQKKKRGFRTKREAKEYEIECHLKLEGQSTMTFRSLAELYLEDCRARCKPNVYASMKYYFAHVLYPYFGEMKVQDITAAAIRKWQNDILMPHYKKTTATTYTTYMNTIFNFGIRYYGLSKNPVSLAGPIRYPNEMGTEKKIHFWTREQFEQFLSCVKLPEHQIAYKILFWTGIRRGELFGLRICDIDLENNKLHIVQNMVTNRFGGPLIQSPKTRSSCRVIGISKKLASDIRAYLDKFYDPKPTDRLVPWRCPSSLDKHMLRIQQENGIEPCIRVHDLRHSHASMLINLGISPKAVADRLGHANENLVIRVYGHLYPEKRNEIVDKLNSIE